MRLGDVEVEIAGMYRDGAGTPIVFLHGFGSTKEDYADVVHQEGLAGRPVLAYDAPGHGASQCSDPAAVSVPFLVAVAEGFLRTRGVHRFYLVGHSMGGLTGLLLAERNPTKVAGFVDIEGNLAPEDCFLSRQMISHHHIDPQTFLDEFTERAWTSHAAASTLYATALPHKVMPAVVRPIFESMVDLSDHGDLLHRFLALPLPRMFLYGRDNHALSYLPQLVADGVELAEIPHSGHWPMYSNPPEPGELSPAGRGENAGRRGECCRAARVRLLGEDEYAS
jgi:pimeloyl-ACP methyl ester carboxylesterase